MQQMLNLQPCEQGHQTAQNHQGIQNVTRFNADMNVKIMQNIVETVRGVPQHQEQYADDQNVEKRIVKQR